MIDCYGANESRLDDMRGINDLFSEITGTLSLTAVMPPFLLPYYYSKNPLDVGISAFVLLEGGHITMHTFPQRECVFIDMLVDGYFDPRRLREILQGYFNYTDENIVRTERRYLDTSIDKDRILEPGYLGEGDFGPHIIARIEDCDVTLEGIYDILDTMPERINMCPISRPLVLKSSATEPKYISGIVLIAQSHIAFHYDIELRTLYCDLFSCSFYKSEKFTAFLEGIFGKFENMTIIRGSKHEKNIKNYESKICKLAKWAKNAK